MRTETAEERLKWEKSLNLPENLSAEMPMLGKFSISILNINIVIISP